MSQSDRHPDAEPDTVDVGEDIQDGLNFYHDVLGHDEDQFGELADGNGDPDAELFVDRSNDTSLSEQARNDAELLTSGRVNGARAYLRDFVPALTMWGLFIGAIAIVAEVVIDFLGPAAGPLWDLRQTLSRMTLMAVTQGSDLLLLALRSDFLLLAALVVGGYLIFRKRRW